MEKLFTIVSSDSSLNISLALSKIVREAKLQCSAGKRNATCGFAENSVYHIPSVYLNHNACSCTLN